MLTENKSQIFFEKENKLLKNITIFNISFEDDDKSNKYLLNYLSNENIFIKDKEKEKEYSKIKEENEEKNSNSENLNKEYRRNKNNNSIKEILSILRKPINNKNIKFYDSPFKPLLKPKNISMEGRIIYY